VAESSWFVKEKGTDQWAPKMVKNQALSKSSDGGKGKEKGHQQVCRGVIKMETSAPDAVRK